MPWNPVHFTSEFVYSSLIVFLCLFVFFKTKEIYALSKHKGIKYFRLTFLFFALAYLTRFILNLFQLSLVTVQVHFPFKILHPFVFSFVGFFSTLALCYLAYSSFWKKNSYKLFTSIALLLSLIVAIVAFITSSPFVIALVQIPLILLLIISTVRSKNFILYVLISLFWLLNILILNQKGFLPFDSRYIVQVLSLLVFLYLSHRVVKSLQ